jgi:hypothetical protein
MANRFERLSLSLILFGVIFAKLAFFSPVLSDGDTWWHLQTGRVILATWTIPDTDPFSFTMAGAPWHAHEWLSEVIFAGTLQAAGWGGIIALGAALPSMSGALITNRTLKHLPLFASLPPLLLLAIIIVSFGLLRPHLFSLPLLLVWLHVLLDAAENRRPPWLPASALMLVWVNLHASFLLGILLILPIAFEAICENPHGRQQVKGWAKFLLSALFFATLSPFNFQSFVFPFSVSGMESLPFINEWKVADLKNSWLFLLLVGILAAALFKYRPRLSLARSLIVVVSVVMALAHVRHQYLFAPVLALLVAGPLGRAVAAKSRPRTVSYTDRFFLLGIGGVIGALVLARLMVVPPIDRLHRLPFRAISAVPASLRACPVFNDYSFGGPLVYSGVRPFIDGRADMYGDDLVKIYVKAERGDLETLSRILKRYGIRWSILPPASQANSRLKVLGWSQLYADVDAVVLRAPAAANDARLGGPKGC